MTTTDDGYSSHGNSSADSQAQLKIENFEMRMDIWRTEAVDQS